jgi:hypothetical protein
LGRTFSSNYEPDSLLPEARSRLIDEAEEGHLNDVSFDIRPGTPEGNTPSRKISGCEVSIPFSTFWADRLEKIPNITSQRSAAHDNPVPAMELLPSAGAPSKADLSIQSPGKQDAVHTTGPLARWNREAFQLLNLLFQMTVSEMPRVGVPSVTTAK